MDFHKGDMGQALQDLFPNIGFDKSKFNSHKSNYSFLY